MRIFICRLVAVFCVLSAIGLEGCNEEPKVAPTTLDIEINPAEQPSQTSYRTTMNFSSDSLLRAILHAGRVRTYDMKHYTLLDSSVLIDFYDKAGRHSSRLTSDSSKIYTLSNNMTAYGNVHIVSDSGTVVDTDSMLWDNRAQTLHSDSHVRIAEKSGRVTLGDGFQSDQNLSHYNILRPTITAPAGSTEGAGEGASSTAPTLKPSSPAIPGSGAFQTPSLPLVPLDTSHH